MIKRFLSFTFFMAFIGFGFLSSGLDAAPIDTLFQFKKPWDIAVNSKGDIFVSDFEECVIYKISKNNPRVPPNIWARELFAGIKGKCESKDGFRTSARFNKPSGLGMDIYGDNLYVVDDENGNRIRKINPSGRVTTVSFIDKDDEQVALGNWLDVAVNEAGDLFISESTPLKDLPGEMEGRIRKLNPATRNMETFVVFKFPDPIIASPYFLTFVNDGNLFVSGNGNGSTLQLVSIDPAGSISYAGKEGAGYRDGPLANAIFGVTKGVGYYGGRAMVIESEASWGPPWRYTGGTVREIRLVGPPIVSTLAGKSGSFGYTDAVQDAARFGPQPLGVGIGNGGEVYVADPDNHVLRSISINGKVNTMAGADML